MYAIDPDGGTFTHRGTVTAVGEELMSRHIGWSPSVWVMYTNTETVTAICPADTLLPDGRVTGEIWLTSPAKFERAFIMNEYEARQIGTAVRKIKELDDDAHRETVLAIHQLLHGFGHVSGERMG